MRLGFFGGTFDPPHRGHLAAARAGAYEFALDRVLFAPTANQPLKPDGATASFANRLAMVGLLCESADEGAAAAPTLSGAHSSKSPVIFEASAVDAPLPNGAPNFTVDTLRRLRSELFRSDTLFVIVGADAFLGLRSWRNPEKLLTLAEWIVVSRPGFSFAGLDTLGLTPDQRGRVHLLDGAAHPGNATHIRENLRAGDDCANLLPRAVLDYIRDHHLYGT